MLACTLYDMSNTNEGPSHEVCLCVCALYDSSTGRAMKMVKVQRRIEPLTVLRQPVMDTTVNANITINTTINDPSCTTHYDRTIGIFMVHSCRYEPFHSSSYRR